MGGDVLASRVLWGIRWTEAILHAGVAAVLGQQRRPAELYTPGVEDCVGRCQRRCRRLCVPWGADSCSHRR